MSKPSMTTITVNGDKFNALSAHIGVVTHHDHHGLPQMGSLKCAIDCMVDAHDNVNMPYAMMQKLFQLSNVVTRDKIVPIKVEFWTDESQQDALCTFSFNGWISQWSMSSGQGSNHTIAISLQPELDQKQFVDLKMGN